MKSWTHQFISHNVGALHPVRCNSLSDFKDAKGLELSSIYSPNVAARQPVIFIIYCCMQWVDIKLWHAKIFLKLTRYLQQGPRGTLKLTDPSAKYTYSNGLYNNKIKLKISLPDISFIL